MSDECNPSSSNSAVTTIALSVLAMIELGLDLQIVVDRSATRNVGGIDMFPIIVLDEDGDHLIEVYLPTEQAIQFDNELTEVRESLSDDD